MKKHRIALLLLGVTSQNCGGAERFFPDFFRHYRESSESQHELLFFVDEPTLGTLEKIGKLKRGPGVVVLKNVSNRFKRVLENLNLLRQVLFHRISLIHVTNYGRNYYDRLLFVSKLPAFIRPKIVINIVDCEVPYILSDPQSPRHESYRLRYLPMFRDIRPEGVFTWYELFCEFARKEKLLREDAVLEAARTRFADTEGFAPAPEKKKEIVYAARLTPQKQPLMFVEAVRYLRDHYPQLLDGWIFRIYGNGPLEDEVKNTIRKYGLENLVFQSPTANLRSVFAVSGCFVSTQDYENFPSLSMNEAMAAGNALVARNVGQTNLFLEEGKNGYLAREDNAKGVAEALARFLSNPSMHGQLQKESLRLAHEVHTPLNFIRQIDEFWNKCCGR